MGTYWTDSVFLQIGYLGHKQIGSLSFDIKNCFTTCQKQLILTLSIRMTSLQRVALGLLLLTAFAYAAPAAPAAHDARGIWSTLMAAPMAIGKIANKAVDVVAATVGKKMVSELETQRTRERGLAPTNHDKTTALGFWARTT